MGLDINGTRSLLYAKAMGVDFARTAMIGRQNLNLGRAALKRNLKDFGYTPSDHDLHTMLGGSPPYAESFLRFIGASEIHSYDNTDYEQATHIHDMNEPLIEAHKGRYTVVCDSGSLEHVFNYPVALKNCMEMVRVGGHFLAITPANNFMGHGFYQFSPELFFSTFTPPNGFEMVSVVAFEDAPKARWYSVKSPALVNGRVTLVNRQPVYLLVVAKRITDVVPLRKPPQQSDYVETWAASGETLLSLLNRQPDTAARFHAILIRLYAIAPFGVRGLARRLVHRYRRLVGFNSRCFEPIDPATAARQSDSDASANL